MSQLPSSLPPPPCPPVQRTGPQWTREQIKVIASLQKTLMLCILVYLVMLGLFGLSMAGIVNLLAMKAIAVAMWLTGVLTFIMAMRLAIKVFPTGVGILLAFLGLIGLLIINSRATGILKSHGMRVGFLGADTTTL